MEIIKVNRTLVWIIACLFIVLALMSVYYKFDSCSKCKFEFEDTKYGAGDFSRMYSEKCNFKSFILQQGYNENTEPYNLTFLP